MWPRSLRWQPKHVGSFRTLSEAAETSSIITPSQSLDFRTRRALLTRSSHVGCRNASSSPSIVDANPRSKRRQFLASYNARRGQSVATASQTWEEEDTANSDGERRLGSPEQHGFTSSNDVAAIDAPTAQSNPKPDRIRKIAIDGRCLRSMAETLRAARRQGLADAAVVHPAEEEHFVSDDFALTSDINLDDPQRLSEKLRRIHYQKLRYPEYRKILAERSKLTMMAPDTKERILELLSSHDVLVLVAGTGSGKTTQVPQILLDHALQTGFGAGYRIICTQPRRISATSVARRVAFERGDPQLQHSVGYQIRFVSRRPRAPANVLYCTTGVLLKYLQNDPESLMSKHGALIIDEVHERSMPIDLVLTMVRDVIRRRKTQRKYCPKIILMSATIDAKVYQDYFMQSEDWHAQLAVASIQVRGRTYPVAKQFLDTLLPTWSHLYADDKSITSLLEGTKDRTTSDYIKHEIGLLAQKLPSEEDNQFSKNNEGDSETKVSEPDIESIIPHGLVAAAIAHIAKTTKEGDILVFLPGFAEIEKVFEILTGRKILNLDFTDTKDFEIFKLHSALHETNDRVFEQLPDQCRRIVLATNIAETSITLPQVVYVIDTGKARHAHHDYGNGSSEVSCSWISKASSQQRSGRAGRVRPGHYIALFTKQRFDSFKDTEVPEIMRTNLVKACLDAKAQAVPMDVSELFARTIDSPAIDRVKSAIATLQHMGAFTDKEAVTPLGRILALFPMHPKASKTILMGLLFRCLEPMMIIACTNFDSPLLNSATERGAAAASKALFAGSTESDLFGTINAFREYDRLVNQGDESEKEAMERTQYIRPHVYQEMVRTAGQVYDLLSSVGVLPPRDHRKGVFENIPAELNSNAHHVSLVKALTLGTVNSRLAVWEDTGWRTAEAPKALMAPRSVNQAKKKSEASKQRRRRPLGEVMAYLEQKRHLGDPYPFLHETTMVTRLMAMLFAPDAKEEGSSVVLNKWLDLRVRITDCNEFRISRRQASQLILEFRKAIDRFLVMAFSDLRDESVARRLRSGREQKFNTMLVGDNPLRDAFVNGVIQVLELDRISTLERSRLDENEDNGNDGDDDGDKEPAVSSAVLADSGRG